MNYVEIQCKLNTKSFESQIQSVERKLDDLVADYQTLSTKKGFKEQSNEAIRLRKEIEKTANELKRLKNKQDEINRQGFENAKNGLKDIGNSIRGTITNLAKWGLALIGIRSMYSAIRRAVSLVSSENEGIANQIDIMRSAIANALVPLVQTILNLAVKLMVYINYIYKSLTGKALFDFDKAWQNANKNSGKTAKNVATIKKQLAGFDEMNVLNDTSTSSGSSGVAGGTAGASNIKLTNPFEGWEKFKIPDWVDKLVKFGKWVLDNWEDVVQGLLLTKMFFDILTGNWAGLLLDIVLYLITQLPRLIKAVKEVAIGIWEYLKVWAATMIADIELKLSIISGIIFAAVNMFLNPFKVAKDTIVNIFNSIKTVVKGVFEVIKGIFTGDWKKVMDGFKSIFKGVFDTLWSIAKAPLNLIIGGINSLIRGANRISVKIPDWVPIVGGKNWSVNIKEIPKLERGGIVNMPGKGVMMGNYIAGENGPEAVLPLTDDTLQRLANMIPITVNVTNTMNGRVISRELQRINNESDFAFNR